MEPAPLPSQRDYYDFVGGVVSMTEQGQVMQEISGNVLTAQGWAWVDSFR